MVQGLADEAAANAEKTAAAGPRSKLLLLRATNVWIVTAAFPSDVATAGITRSCGTKVCIDSVSSPISPGLVCQMFIKE